MAVRYAKIEDMELASKIKLDGWKDAYKGIISDDILQNLNYDENQKKFEAGFDEGFFCVCENEEGEVVGFCKFGERQDVEDEGHEEYDCEIISLYVDPVNIGKGIGKQLFEFVLSELRNKNKKKVILWCFEKNISAKVFYEKMGGSLIGCKEQKIGAHIYIEVGFGYDL